MTFNLFVSFEFQEPSSIDDFEAQVLERLKRAQERKNLLQKLESEKETD